MEEHRYERNIKNIVAASSFCFYDIVRRFNSIAFIHFIFWSINFLLQPIVNPLIPFFLIVAVLCGLSLAIFCRRREARLFGYALTIASAIYYLSTLSIVFNYNIGISLVKTPYGIPCLVASGVMLLIFAFVGVLYEYLDFRNEVK